MIVLLALLALVFAWACIATGTAVSWERRHDGERAMKEEWRERAVFAEDRAQASSLSELRTWHPVAMQAAEQGPELLYDYDATGLNRSVRVATPDDE